MLLPDVSFGEPHMSVFVDRNWKIRVGQYREIRYGQKKIMHSVLNYFYLKKATFSFSD